MWQDSRISDMILSHRQWFFWICGNSCDRVLMNLFFFCHSIDVFMGFVDFFVTENGSMDWISVTESTCFRDFLGFLWQNPYIKQGDSQRAKHGGYAYSWYVGLDLTLEMKDIIGDGIWGLYSLSCHKDKELIAFVVDCVTVISWTNTLSVTGCM